MYHYYYGITDAGDPAIFSAEGEEGARMGSDRLKVYGFRLVGFTSRAVAKSVVEDRLQILLARLWWRTLSIAEMKRHEKKYHPDRNWLHLGDRAILEVWAGEGQPKVAVSHPAKSEESKR
jgi:hypothetical protein